MQGVCTLLGLMVCVSSGQKQILGRGSGAVLEISSEVQDQDPCV